MRINSEPIKYIPARIPHNFKESIKNAVASAVKDTCRHKVFLAKNLYHSAKNIFDFTAKKYTEYKEHGLGRAKSDIGKIGKKLKNLPWDVKNRISKHYNEFVSLDTDKKKKKIADMVIYCFTIGLVAKIVGGGFDLDFEGGIPDMDTKIAGLKNHRHVLSHILLPGFCIEILLRTVFNLVREYHKYHHKPYNELLNRIESGAISGAWLGFFLHLLLDSNIMKGMDSRTKALVGLPSMSDDAHQIILATTATTDGVFAIKPESSN